MRRLILAVLLVSPLASATIQITNISYHNISAGTVPGRVSADMTFTISYRNMTDSSPNGSRLRSTCRKVTPLGYFYSDSSYITTLFDNDEIDVPNSGPAYITMNEIYSYYKPDTETLTLRLENAKPDTNVTFTLGLSSSYDPYCISSDNGFAPGPISTPVRPLCNINVHSDLNHGAISLPAVGNSHVANGAVQVTCDNPADVRVSTGRTGSLKINDMLSTDISINGKPNSATKMVNGTELFNVSSRLYRTSVSDWSGSFSQPVIMTISWP